MELDTLGQRQRSFKMNEYTYEIPLDPFGKPSESVILRSDDAWIPTDPANSDYQAYLKQLEEDPDLTEES